MQQQPAEELVERARQGDRAAFDRLAAAHLPRLRSVVRRLVGVVEDGDDILQDTLVKAWRGLDGFRGESAFSTWLTAIATRTALDHLRAGKRWRAEAQVAYANLCYGSEELSGEVMAAASAPDFAFEVREHVAYCFACVGRSLPPDEMAALVLRDVMELSAREASTVLGTSDSVLRHRLSAARQAMTERFEGLCSLVSKTGICHQCKGLQMLAVEDRRGGPFPDVSSVADRIAIVRAAEPGSMEALHAIFWRRTAEIEVEGLGATTPDSGCGTDG
ncbi:RNA polymerase sigma factor [Frigidibacter sp. SD6-1]|uniref:RNA polymerase sigma factor n=1 Tax=Frigidibacter sp. SD6-1 TaxID=3032581 RepID=UPI0024DFB7CB|nr:RNA polymerase sigma factor [Frigidibacter sp. SD6-1]